MIKSKKRKAFTYIETIVTVTGIAVVSLLLLNALDKGVEQVEHNFNIYAEQMTEAGITIDKVDLDVYEILADYVNLENCVEIEGNEYCEIITEKK